MPPITLMLPLLLGSAFALQPPGQFHGDEPVARDGERWLALRVHGGDAALVAVTLSVRAVEDPVLDAPGQRSGRLVTSRGGDDAQVMYLRGPSLRAGAIEPAQVASSASPTTTLPVHDLTFRGQRHRIDTRCDPAPFEQVDAHVHYACRTVLATAGAVQVLATTSGHFEPGATTMSLGEAAAPQLLFAGDLDRDGQLDLLFDATDHYNVSRPTLFLSSQAAPGALLGEAARYESVGC